MEDEGWDPSCIKIESQGEIITALETATVTQTLEALRAKYGDDALDPLTRPAQERAWMVPSEEQAAGQQHYESERLLHPQRCIVLGVTNTGMGLALYCADEAEIGEKQPELPVADQPEADQQEGKIDAATTKMLNWYERYGKCNLAFRFKLELLQIEQAAYQRHLAQTLLYYTHSQEEVKRLLEYTMDRARFDYHLRGATRALAPVFGAQLKHLRTRRMPARPAATTPMQGIWPIQAEAEPEVVSGTTKWTLQVCRGGPWKEQRKIAIHTWAKTAPLSAMSDTHLLFFYQSATRTFTHRLYHLCDPSGTLKLVAEQHWRADALPRQMQATAEQSRSTHGSLALGPDGYAALAIQAGVLIWRPAEREEQAHVIALEGRELSAVQIAAGDALCVGTTLGEAYTINWRSAELLAYDALRTAEPVWAVRYRPVSHARYLLSVMSVTQCASWDHKALGMDRPVAMDMCGALIYVVSKYGFINVFDAHTRAVCHQFPPPESKAKTPPLQQCYVHGVRAMPDALYVVYADGLVRSIKLGKEK